jgi:hypothetical protein
MGFTAPTVDGGEWRDGGSFTWLLRAMAAMSAFGATACGVPVDDIPSSPYRTPPSRPHPVQDAGTIDEAAALASIAHGAYKKSSSFVEVTEAPFPSTVTAGATISEWVSAAGAKAFDEVSPGVSGSKPSIPVGTMIVRAVLDDDGETQKLTLMLKGPPGYNPDLGDWWFGVTDPNGVPAESDAGAMIGRLTQCYSCHIPRSDDGYLFGAPLDDRDSDDGARR